jgi:hypothetical protein
VPEAPAEPAAAPARLAASFVALLRRLGVEVPTGSAVVYYEALGAVGLTRRDPVYWAGRACLIHDPELVPLYDAAFAAFFQDLPLMLDRRAGTPDVVTLMVDDEDAELPEGGEDDGDEGDIITLRYSPAELLGHKDFAEYSDAELDEAYRLMTRFAHIGGRRRSRRRHLTAHRTSRLALRATVRRALRSEGEMVERRFTTPGERPRRLVFLLDVSGSMESYARALLRFTQAAVAGRQRVEVFTLGTRLTRVTRELSGHDPDHGLARASLAVNDWSGGTRLGDALRVFNDGWGQRGMARGATVVILSDGWDRGDPAVMAEQMARLARVAHQVVWVNPLKATPGYQPLAAGMAAALPFIDRFVEGHNLESLELLADLLEDDAVGQRRTRARKGVPDAGVGEGSRALAAPG